MKNDTIKITDKVVMARYISGVSSSQKDQDGIFAEAEQIYDHGFTYFNVDKENNKAIFIPETKTDGLDQSTINWALKKGIINISKTLGDMSRDINDDIDSINHVLSTIPADIHTYSTKISKNTSDINNLFSHMEQAEDTIRDNYHNISDLQRTVNNISQSGFALNNIDTRDEFKGNTYNPSNRFGVYPTYFIPGAPATFIIYPLRGYKFRQSEFTKEDGPAIVYSGPDSEDISERYDYTWINDSTVILSFDKAPTKDVELCCQLGDPDGEQEEDIPIEYESWIDYSSRLRSLTRTIHCEIPHVTLSAYYIDSIDSEGETTFEFYAYCENGFKFNKNTLDVVGRRYKNRMDETSAVASLTFNEDATVCKIKINLYPIINGKNTYAFATGFTCVGSVLPIEDTDEPVVNHTVTLNLSNVSDINISNERTSQTPKTKTLTYTVASNSTLTVPLYKYSNTSDFNYAIDGNPTGGPNHAPNVIVNDSNFYYEEVEGVLVLHITSIWGDCTFDISANYVDDSTIPSQPTDEDDNPVTTPTLQVSPSQITLSYDDFEPRVITVTSNSNFTIK